MMEQMCFDTIESDEQKAFELVYPHLKDIIFDAPLDSGILVFQELANYSSVYFLNSNELFFRIRLRKKSRYIGLPASCERDLPAGTVISRTKAEENMIRVHIQNYDDILNYLPALRTLLMSLCRKYRDVGCCGRYEKCSDAKECIHPDPKFALRCWYRLNLVEGKIFYGKNRNIS